MLANNVIQLKKDAPQPETTENRLPQRFPELSLVQKLDEQYQKHAAKKQQLCAKSQNLALGILQKKSIQHRLFDRLLVENVPAKPVAMALVLVAQQLQPEATVSAANINKMIENAAKDSEISAKWWSERFPLLLDELGFTCKKNETVRAFASIKQLTLIRSDAAKLIDRTGYACACLIDSTASKIVERSAYVEKQGDKVIYHQRPEQTAEGKAARRRVDQEAYLAKQQEKLNAVANSETTKAAGQWETYKMPALIVALVVLSLVALAEFQSSKELKTQNNQSMSFDPNIIAEGGGY